MCTLIVANTNFRRDTIQDRSFCLLSKFFCYTNRSNFIYIPSTLLTSPSKKNSSLSLSIQNQNQNRSQENDPAPNNNNNDNRNIPNSYNPFRNSRVETRISKFNNYDALIQGWKVEAGALKRRRRRGVKVEAEILAVNSWGRERGSAKLAHVSTLARYYSDKTFTTGQRQRCITMSDSAVRRCSRLQHANKTPRTSQGLGGRVMRIRVGLCLPVAVSPDGSRKGEKRRTPLVLLTLASALATWNIKWRGSLVPRFRVLRTSQDFMRQLGFLPFDHLLRAWPRRFEKNSYGRYL